MAEVLEYILDFFVGKQIAVIVHGMDTNARIAAQMPWQYDHSHESFNGDRSFGSRRRAPVIHEPRESCFADSVVEQDGR
jgi:hypothetical protein